MAYDRIGWSNSGILAHEAAFVYCAVSYIAGLEARCRSPLCDYGLAGTSSLHHPGSFQWQFEPAAKKRAHCSSRSFMPVHTFTVRYETEECCNSVISKRTLQHPLAVPQWCHLCALLHILRIHRVPYARIDMCSDNHAQVRIYLTMMICMTVIRIS